MTAFKCICDVFFKYLGYVCIFLLTVLVVDVLLGVFFRYVLSNSLTWSGEAARYLCIWLSFIGCATLKYQRGHVGLEFLINAFPKRMQTAVTLINDILILVFLAYVAWYGTQLAMMKVGQRSSALLISMAIPYASVPSGAVLMALAVIHNIVMDVYALIHHKDVREV